MSNWLIYGGVVCLEEVSLGCPFPRIRNCIRLGFGYWGAGAYERSKTKHFDPRRRCRHSYWQRMVNNLPTSCTQELLVSSMETNNEGLGIYAIDGIDSTRIFLHQDEVSIHCGQLIDKKKWQSHKPSVSTMLRSSQECYNMWVNMGLFRGVLRRIGVCLKRK